MAGDYSEQDVLKPDITNPDDDIALQDNRIFALGLLIGFDFVDDVELGAVIGADQTFPEATLTVVDDDGI